MHFHVCGDSLFIHSQPGPQRRGPRAIMPSDGRVAVWSSSIGTATGAGAGAGAGASIVLLSVVIIICIYCFCAFVCEKWSAIVPSTCHSNEQYSTYLYIRLCMCMWMYICTCHTHGPLRRLLCIDCTAEVLWRN